MQQKMWRCVVGLSLLFLIVCASVARSDSKAGNTGITGVVLVTPIRPGPIRAGSESSTAAPPPNATFSVTGDDGAVKTFTTDANGRFQISLRPGRSGVLLAESRF